MGATIFGVVVLIVLAFRNIHWILLGVGVIALIVYIWNLCANCAERSRARAQAIREQEQWEQNTEKKIDDMFS